MVVNPMDRFLVVVIRRFEELLVDRGRSLGNLIPPPGNK